MEISIRDSRDCIVGDPPVWYSESEKENMNKIMHNSSTIISPSYPSIDIITNIPKIQSKVIINDNFSIYFYKQKPNFLWRFFYYTLLGWRWENV